MLNSSEIQGRLTKDIELKYTGNGTPVTSFCLACERDYRNEATGERDCDFIDFVAWRRTAEFINEWFHKGDMMIVKGRLQKRSYTDRDGNTKYVTEVVAENAYFGGSKRDNDSGQYQGGSYGNGQQYQGNQQGYQQPQQAQPQNNPYGAQPQDNPYGNENFEQMGFETDSFSQAEDDIPF